MRMKFSHRVGNVLQSFVNIAENLVVILTFSYYMPNWLMKFILWRLDNKWLYNPYNPEEIN